MKNRWLIALCAFLAFSQVQAQTSKNWFNVLHPEIVEEDVYATPDTGQFVQLHMSFAEAAVHNPDELRAILPKAEFYAVDIVYTRYPHDLSTWEIGHANLLQQRFEKIRELAPGIMHNRNVEWRLVLQTHGKDLKTAERMFHGVVLRYRVKMTSTVRSELGRVREAVDSNTAMADSAVMAILGRHTDWNNMLVVTDWTGSMYKYGAEVLLWHKLNQGRIDRFIFFNDGDFLKTEKKTIGGTGGIYATRGNDLEEVIRTVAAAASGGNGGDVPENDLEALIYAIDHYGAEYPEIFLIADNTSFIRDIQLLPFIDRPVHVVLCGSPNQPVHPHYLTLAYHTGGSIHFLEQDIEDVAGEVKNGRIMIGDNEYEYRKGRFTLLKGQANR